MNCDTNLTCNDTTRRDLLVNTPAANGIASVEVVPRPFGDPLYERLLDVFFFRAYPAAFLAQLKLFSFTGGARIAGSLIFVQQATAVSPTVLRLQLNQAGDFSDYTLTINDPSLDLLFTCYSFNFQIDCPRLADCKPPVSAPRPLPPDPAIDYLTKDYDSFLQALLNFLPTRVPGFHESSEADLAITLAELFAYAGDQLSYYQDAIANEATLASARQRISAKRHAVLVDYHMHDGLAATVILHLHVFADTVIPYDPANGIVFAVSTNEADPQRRVVFEAVESVPCHPELNQVQPWAWRGTDCCLPSRATQIDLAGHLSTLGVGQLLLVEEVLGRLPQGEWSPTAADPAHRQVVRITQIDYLVDALDPGTPQTVTRVSWDAVDALTWPVCLVAAGLIVTVARGNLIRATHGQTRFNEPVNVAKTSTLAQSPLTFLLRSDQNAPPWTWLYPPDPIDPRNAISSVRLSVNGQTWIEEESLLNSQANDADFVVDTNDDGAGVLRFGDGQLGRALPENATVFATYRVGNGSAGNVGRDSLVRPAGALPAGVASVRNPLAASGGIDPETIEHVQQSAPYAFAAEQYRAVTAADYAAAAVLVHGVANAAARFSWTGSWLTVLLSIEATGRFSPPASLVAAVMAQLNRYRQTGYDLEIRPPDYVPLRIDLTICVEDSYFQADVLGVVSQVLGAGLRPDQSPGFFSPDAFTFGQPAFLSRIYAAVQEVIGVKEVHATTFRPLLRPDTGELSEGVIDMGPFQIVRLDNDPSRPENGELFLSALGGL